jgi:hypothetical protein
MRSYVFAGLAVCAIASSLAAQQIVTQEVRTLPGGSAIDTVVGGIPGGGPSNTPMPMGTAVVFGQVTEADSTRPVAGAIVTLSIPGVQPLRVMADGQGRFGFRDLPKGRFNLGSTRPGWSDGAYGRTRPGGTALGISLAEGEKVSGVVVPMWRFASITGTVLDELGEPIVNASVRVLKRQLTNGRVRLTPQAQDTTDDRGIYRIGMLEPGEYVVAIPMSQGSPMLELPMLADGRDVAVTRVMAAARVESAAAVGGMMFFNADGSTPVGMTEDGRLLAYPTVFYPNAAGAAKAQILTVASGDERSGIDFGMKAVPTVKLSGIANGPEGPVTNLQLSLIPSEADDLVTGIETLTGFTDGQGRFTISNVPPGQYTLRAVRAPRSAGIMEERMMGGGNATFVVRSEMSSSAGPVSTTPTLWAEMTVAVGAKDVSDLAVGLRPGIKIAGMVQFNGVTERPTAQNLGSLNIVLTPADVRPGVQPARGRTEATGTFATSGVPPGKYLVSVQGGFPNWTFQSAMVNGRDASIYPVDIESNDLSGVMINFTDRPSEVSGQASADTGSPEALSVLVFPADQTSWTGPGAGSPRRFLSTRAEKDGKYRVANVPAGEYLAVAVPDKQIADWQRPKFLESLMPSATRFRVQDGDKVVQNLKVAR